jgi:hypothetical protein
MYTVIEILSEKEQVARIAAVLEAKPQEAGNITNWPHYALLVGKNKRWTFGSQSEAMGFIRSCENPMLRLEPAAKTRAWKTALKRCRA